MYLCPIEPSLVAGTAGTYAVAWSQTHQHWLILRLTSQPDGHPVWTWVESDQHEAGARRLAHALYVRELAREALG